MSNSRTHKKESTVRKQTDNHPIDLVHLSGYTIGDTKLQNEILQSFLTQSDDNFNTLKKTTSYEEWCNVLHTLKGTSRNVGAFHLSNVIEHAETIPSELLEIHKLQALAAIELCIIEMRNYVSKLHNA